MIFIFKLSLKQRIYYKGEKARNYLSVDKSRFRVRFVYHYLLHMVTQSATIAVPPRLRCRLHALLSTEGRRDFMASFSFSLLLSKFKALSLTDDIQQIVVIKRPISDHIIRIQNSTFCQCVHITSSCRRGYARKGGDRAGIDGWVLI